MARQGRTVVLVNAALTLVIVGLVAGVSVLRSPAGPPTISEFAPANPGRVTAVATAQPARGGDKEHRVGPLARPTARPGVPSSLTCWSWADGSTTQTFDRQSPPCIAGWDVAAGNGGTTSRGVTASEVRVGVPAASVAAWEPLATFVNRHYQLYGRRLRLVPLGAQDLSTPEGQRAAASSAVERRVFAALEAPGDDTGRDPGIYLDALAADGVLGVLTGPTQVSTTALGAQAPYVWSREPALDTVQRTLAAVACRELSGQRARFSPQTAGLERRFAVLAPAARANGGSTFEVDALRSGLERCHVEVVVREYDPAARASLEAALSGFQRDGLTTVVPFGTTGALTDVLMPAAASVGYEPEWLLAGLGDRPDLRAWSRAPASQRRAAFGLATWGPALPETRRPAYQALHEVAPARTLGPADQDVYDGLTLLAAGIQTAGPRLTPDAFARGLETTTFANPGAGAAPDHQARVGFADLDHAMVDDLSQVWWQGDGFCFIGGGRRWAAEEVDYSDPGFFDPARGC